MNQHKKAFIQNDLELEVAEVWTDVLQLQNYTILPTDNFFLLGGDSLKMSQIMARLVDRLVIELKLSDLFLMSSVRKMAKHCQAALKLSPCCSNDIISDYEKDHPASAAQSGLWYIEQLHADRRVLYNTAIQLDVTGELNVKCLGKALNALVVRHECLRSRFYFMHKASKLMVNYAPAYSLDTTVHEIDKSSLLECVQNFVHKPFELSEGQLFRTCLVSINPSPHEGRRHVLVLCIHHIISDGWSGGVLLNDLALLYKQYINDSEQELDLLTTTYAEYCHWQKKQLISGAFDAAINYWKSTLNGLPYYTVQHKAKNLVRSSYHCASKTFQITGEEFIALKELANAESTSLFILTQTIFTVVLSLIKPGKEVVLGVPVANRQFPDWEGLVGYFVNILVLRNTISPDYDFLASLREIQKTTLLAFEHQTLPFQSVVDLLRADKPLFEVLFVYQNSPLNIPEFEGLTISYSKPENKYCHYELGLEISEQYDGLVFNFEYASELFSETQIMGLMQTCQNVLLNVIDLPVQENIYSKQHQVG